MSRPIDEDTRALIFAFSVVVGIPLIGVFFTILLLAFAQWLGVSC